MSAESSEREPPSDVHELLARIDASWRQFLAASHGIAEERFAEPGVAGDWSLQDLFGHIAFWDEHALAGLERALAGQPRAENDWQAMNEAEYAARRNDTLPGQRAALPRAHAALVEGQEALCRIAARRLDAR